MNNAGNIAFVGTYDNGTRAGLFVTGTNGALRDVASSDGDVAPGAVGQFGSFERPRLNDTGTLAFRARSGSAPMSRQAVYTSPIDPGPLTYIFGHGDQSLPGRTVKATSVGYPELNDAGDMVFRVNFGSSGVDHALLSYDGQHLDLVAATDPGGAPGFPDLSTITLFPKINAAGEITVKASYADGPGSLTESVFSNVGGPFRSVIRPGLASASYSDPVMSSTGRIAFKGSGGFGPTDVGIFSTDSSGVLQAVARSTDPTNAPGAQSRFSNMDPPQINASGQVAFRGLVDGGSREGIWVSDPQGELRLIALEGQTWDLDGLPGGPTRIIESVSLGGGVTFLDGARALNDAGDLAFQIRFTPESGGGSGVYVTSIPEPALFWPAILGPLARLTRRRR